MNGKVYHIDGSCVKHHVRYVNAFVVLCFVVESFPIDLGVYAEKYFSTAKSWQLKMRKDDLNCNAFI